MNKPFKFRHATLIAGVFIGLSIVLVTLGVLRTRDLSEIMGHLLSKEHHKVVHVIQKASSAAAVEDDAAQSGYAVTPMIVRGSRVQLLGQTIGIVKDVELSDGEGNVLLPGDVHMNPDYHLKGELRLHGNFAKLVTRDSKVVLSEDMAGFGGVYLEIIPQGGEAVRDGDRPLLVEYSGRARTEMEKLVTTLNHVAGELSGLQEQVKPMLAANSSLRSGLGNIVEYLEKVTKQLPEVLQSAKDSADAIKLLANSAKPEEGMMKKIDAMVASINNFAHKLEVMKVEALQNQLLSLGKSLEATSKAVMTMSGSIEKTSQSAQESFLLRGGTRRVEEKKQADERAKTSAEAAKTKAQASGATPAMPDATAKRGFFQKWFGSD